MRNEGASEKKYTSTAKSCNCKQRWFRCGRKANIQIQAPIARFEGLVCHVRIGVSPVLSDIALVLGSQQQASQQDQRI